MLTTEEIYRRRAWIFLQEFLPSVKQVLGISNYEEYLNIVVGCAIVSACDDIGKNILANKIIISYDLYSEEIKHFFNEEGEYYD